MKILSTISDLNLFSGGPTLSLYLLVKKLREKGVNVNILTTKHKDNDNEIISNEKFIKIFELNKFQKQIYSKDIIDFLKENNDFDIFHTNGLWQLLLHYSNKIAIKNKKPFIISPRGMLRHWALDWKKNKKKIALWLYQNNDLRKANCLHTTAKIEADEIRELGYKNPIAIIPNGLDLNEYQINKSFNNKNKKKNLLYLSRVFPKKGLENLIDAFSLISKSNRKDWEIIIVGDGEKKYFEELKKRIEKKNLSEEIKFLGPKYGVDKVEIFNQADFFVLPTCGENFGMAIAEALAFGVPVITTKGAPWEDLIHHNAGWWIDIGVEPLAQAITEAIGLSDEERSKMGSNGRKLVEEKYSVDIVANKFIELYEWLLNKREKPEFVYLD